MYIKSVTIDGFKSYGRRMEITGFDTQFNAITGLNGTGKSNVLDAICFVLGISNLTHVRANNLQDLIFKNGQAGITKATVTIVFDNRNLEQSPPGYEDSREISITRQIEMGGKNKYWINGLVAQNKKVQDLFCSIQLNVNNPHFLIMQGRVTKVINMKPHEILSMVEEAVGTRNYEAKRIIVAKTMDKKESKLQEMREIQEEDLLPRINKLREERKAYFEYLALEKETQNFQKLYEAWLYYAIQKAVQVAQKNLQDIKDKGGAIESEIAANENQTAAIIERIKEAELESDGGADGKVQQLGEEIKSKSKEEAKINIELKQIQGNMKNEKTKISDCEKSQKFDVAALEKKENELANANNVFKTLQENDERDGAAFELAQKRYEAVCAGMELTESGETLTVQDQLIAANQAISESRIAIQVATNELQHSERSLKEKQKQLSTNAIDYKEDKSIFDRLQAEIKSLETQVSKIDFSEERLREQLVNYRTMRSDVQTHRDKVEQFDGRRPHTKFSYRDPAPNFQREKVHGVVCKLFQVNDPKFSMALETAGGGKLFNVVIEDEHTGKLLLQRGNLQRRCTFIPLNKIQGGQLSQSVVKCAQNLVGANNVFPALSLISYDRKLQSAMEFVFGNVFICTNMDVASKIAYHNKIQTRCVTLDGDVCDPGGTLSGGATKKGTPILIEIADVLKSENILKSGNEQLGKLENEINQLTRLQEKLEAVCHQLDTKKCELKVIEAKLQQNANYQQQEEVTALTNHVQTLKESIATHKKVEADNVKKAKDLELKKKDAKGHRDKMTKQAKDAMDKCKVQADKSRAAWENREQEFRTLTVEIVELKKELENVQEQINTCNKNLADMQQEFENKTQNLKEIKELLVTMQEELEQEQAKIAARNKEIQKLVHKKEQLTAKKTEMELSRKRLEVDIRKLAEEHAEAVAREKRSAKQDHHEERYLKQAREMSDKAGNELRHKLEHNKTTLHKLERTVNPKAQSMYEQDEAQYEKIRNGFDCTKTDKSELSLVIDNLEDKKRKALELAYSQIKDDFGSILRMLLPGADATLRPPAGKSILEGLEIKVSLGGIWKDSLTELSGGQRSLVALSLILAMLLFKPAPLYILDEVDAALDLSHTQNIGTMLKAHFKQSQFIIVSLKEGMFSNANVLFRTAFVDGMSMIKRTTNKST